MQRALIRIGLDPNHPVRLALANNSLAMFSLYKELFDLRRKMLVAIRSGNGDWLAELKAQKETEPFDPHQHPSSNRPVQRPRAWRVGRQ